MILNTSVIVWKSIASNYVIVWNPLPLNYGIVKNSVAAIYEIIKINQKIVFHSIASKYTIVKHHVESNIVIKLLVLQILYLLYSIIYKYYLYWMAPCPHCLGRMCCPCGCWARSRPAPCSGGCAGPAPRPLAVARRGYPCCCTMPATAQQ